MKMKIYMLVHEYDSGFTCYAFSSEEQREKAAALLKQEYARDFEKDQDFLIYDESDLDAMPWEVGSADTHDNEKKWSKKDA